MSPINSTVGHVRVPIKEKDNRFTSNRFMFARVMLSFIDYCYLNFSTRMTTTLLLQIVHSASKEIYSK